MPKTNARTDARTVSNKARAGARTTRRRSTRQRAAKVTPFGSFGKLISFSVSDSKIMTFESMQREGEARWKKHELIQQKPIMEFLGPGQESITMTIILDARHGIKPRETINNIIAYRDKGKADYLIIGGKSICANKLVITKSSDTWDEIWNQGELVRATMELTFTESA